MDDDEIHLRRSEEVEALLSYYGEDDFKRSLKEFNSSSSSSNVASSSASASWTGDELSPRHSSTPSQSTPPLDGPWFLRLRLHDNTIKNNISNDNRNHSNNDATLELRLPCDYPLGSTPPTLILHMHNNNNNMNGVASIDSNTKRQFLQGLQDEYVEGTCVGIYWAECCREFLLQAAAVKNDEDCDSGGRQLPISSEDASVNNNNNNTNNLDSTDQEKMITFLPSTTRFHQPIRHFSSSIISNPIYQCKVHRTSPFHPPNSGASECLIAHVAKVTCMEHVLWTLGQLLLCDKKVGKASHNMFAYRFYTSSNENAGESGGGGGGGSGGRSTRVLVSDNDDDGEKGSGKKLSALLELCHVENVLVVVSRWFGGELLGAARFKWIASVAKDGLVQAGLV